ncbi:MAG TPA: glutamyl-tRNA reductase [Actinomycetes bacterium]|nr:glutamyl-tRNA reductase [Actinomycetes bacterium]
MSVIALGVSHRTAALSMLERLALDADGVSKLLHDLTDNSTIDEAMVLATCNRVEVYVEAEKFHPAVDAATERLSRHTGVGHDELVPHLYVHYEDRAVQHLFAVASGLDSMVVGEGQILGQVRSAMRLAQDDGTLGRTLNELTQNALRVGKRAHAETGIDQAGASLVSVGLSAADGSLSGLADKRAVVVGAGSMASLAATSLQRLGLDVVVVNRSPERAEALAASIQGRALPMSDLETALGDTDLVVSCTGAMGHVIGAELLARIQVRRDHAPLVLLDLALPRDIDPGVLGIGGVTLIDLEDMGALLQDGSYEQDVEDVRRIVALEVESFLDARHSARVAPTVVALRSLAAEIVARELDWFAARRPDVGPQDRADIEQLVGRVVDKLLHSPTVRVKELAAEPDGDAYAEALHRLFDLDLKTVEALRTPDLSAELSSDTEEDIR